MTVILSVVACHCYENELQWPNSFSPALSRKPGPGPWTPACAGATVESGGHIFIVLRGLRKAIVILRVAEESTRVIEHRLDPKPIDPSTSLRVTLRERLVTEGHTGQRYEGSG